MEFSKLIKVRQSDRKYLDKPVESALVEQCVEATRLSPSANNAQPWKFIVIDEPGLRDRVAECASSMGMNKFVAGAPVIIAVVMEKTNTLSKIASVIQDKEYPLLDLGIASNQLCLQAADLGLGTCMVGWFNKKKLKDLLGIERKKRVPLIITLGWPDSPMREKVRKPIEQVYSRNKY